MDNKYPLSSSFSPPISILELGSGCGLVGMGLASSGLVDDVIVTDRDVSWLNTSVMANHPTFTPSSKSTADTTCGDGDTTHWSTASGGSLTVMKLEWGTTTTTTTTATTILASTRKRTTRNPQQQEQDHESHHGDDDGSRCCRPLDYIVGSDILYHPDLYDRLLATMGDLATPDHTQILLAYPERSVLLNKDDTDDDPTMTATTTTIDTATTTTDHFANRVRANGTFRMVRVHELPMSSTNTSSTSRSDMVVGNKKNNSTTGNTTTTNYSLMRLIKR
jgi:hypothetical protein